MTLFLTGSRVAARQPNPLADARTSVRAGGSRLMPPPDPWSEPPTHRDWYREGKRDGRREATRFALFMVLAVVAVCAAIGGLAWVLEGAWWAQ